MKNLFFVAIIVGVAISQLIQNTDSLFDEPTTALYARSGMFQITYIIGLSLVGAMAYFGHSRWKTINMTGKALLGGAGITILVAAALIGGQSDTLFTPKGYALCSKVGVGTTYKNTQNHMVYHKNQAACDAFKARVSNPTSKEFAAALNAINQEYK